MYIVMLNISDAYAWTFGLEPTVSVGGSYDLPPEPHIPRRLVTRWRKLFADLALPWVAVVGEA